MYDSNQPESVLGNLPYVKVCFEGSFEGFIFLVLKVHLKVSSARLARMGHFFTKSLGSWQPCLEDACNKQESKYNVSTLSTRNMNAKSKVL